MPYDKSAVVERMRELAKARVPFLHQGRSFDGIDCVGALIYGFQYEGDVPAYPRDPVNGELEKELIRVFGQPILYRSSLQDPLIDTNDLQEGDVLSMHYAGPARHVAVVVNHVDQVNCPRALSIVHTDSNQDHVTEHILDGRWIRRIIGVWRP